MIGIERRQIGDIPLLHLVKQPHHLEKLPFIIFLHGFTSTAERNLHYAYLMAEKGFRVALPEAIFHGTRQKGMSKVDLNLHFWDIVLNTIEEISTIKNFYDDKGLIDVNRIGLAGTSMGAIATLGALTQHDWVKAAVSLMGIPSYEEFAKWQMEQIEKYGISLNISDEEKEQMLARLRPFDLSLQPQKLKNRPLLFWHGKRDPEVPFTPAYQFYEEIIGTNIQDPGRLRFIVDEKAGHNVSGQGVIKTVEWFEKFL
jgi:uncharacterized protein